jgi:hypothetical protein
VFCGARAFDVAAAAVPDAFAEPAAVGNVSLALALGLEIDCVVIPVPLAQWEE